MLTELYRDFNTYLRGQFGCRVQKISIDAGLTCPTRDGSKGVGGCIYCNARGSGTGAAARGQTVTRQLIEAKSYLARRYKAKKFLAYFQSYSNTYGPAALLRELFEEALSVPDVVGLCIGTRPDCVDDEILEYLETLARDSLIWLEYGLQSAHDETLQRIRRGHTVGDFSAAVQRTRRRNLPICVHVILGLPGEDRRHMLATARYLAALDIQAVKIHMLYVVRGTPLEELYREGSYQCLERDEYASIVGEFLALLPPRVVIQRLTGDPHPGELVAPTWALEKSRNLLAIHDYMVRHSLVQGSALAPAADPLPPTHAHVDSCSRVRYR